MLLSFGIQTLLYALFFVLLLRYGRKFFAPVDNIVRHVMDLNKNIHDSEPFSVENAGGLIDNASCATCHHYELGAKKWGHKKHQEEYGVDCRECHHKNTDIEPEPQNCADCHDSGAPTGQKAEKGTPPDLADAVHARCVTCHEEMFAAKAKGCAQCHSQTAVRDILPKQGLVKLNPMFTNCAVCHGLPAEKLIPGRMDAYHKLCMGCHEKLKKGPYGKQQCAQCHTSK